MIWRDEFCPRARLLKHEKTASQNVVRPRQTPPLLSRQHQGAHTFPMGGPARVFLRARGVRSNPRIDPQCGPMCIARECESVPSGDNERLLREIPRCGVNVWLNPRD